MKLLLIEDDIELATSLVDRFSEQGYSTQHVSDGRIGLAEALRGEFTAIVVDRMLPGMDGLSLVKALRREKSTPVLYLTTMGGVSDCEIITWAFRKGVAVAQCCNSTHRGIYGASV